MTADRFDELMLLREEGGRLTEEQADELEELCEADPARALEMRMLLELEDWERRPLPSEPELLIENALGSTAGTSYLKAVPSGREKARSPQRRSRKNGRRLALAALFVGVGAWAAWTSQTSAPADSSAVGAQGKPLAPPPASPPASATKAEEPGNADSTSPAFDAAPADLGAKTAEGEADRAPVLPQARALSVEGLLDEARAATLAGNHGSAARAYTKLRRHFPGSPAAHTVLISLGKLQLHQLGSPGAAAQSFEAYLKRGGPLAQEARQGLTEAKRRLAGSEATRSLDSKTP